MNKKPTGICSPTHKRTNENDNGNPVLCLPFASLLVGLQKAKGRHKSGLFFRQREATMRTFDAKLSYKLDHATAKSEQGSIFWRVVKALLEWWIFG